MSIAKKFINDKRFIAFLKNRHVLAHNYKNYYKMTFLILDKKVFTVL